MKFRFASILGPWNSDLNHFFPFRNIGLRSFNFLPGTDFILKMDASSISMINELAERAQLPPLRRGSATFSMHVSISNLTEEKSSTR